MRSLARLAVVAGTAAAILNTVTPAAHAGSDSMQGGCAFNTDAPPPSTTQSGVMSDVSVTFDSTGQLTAATVSCALDINGTIDPNTIDNFSGFGVQAGAATLSYADPPGTSITLCTRVQYADGYDTSWLCQFEPPPPPRPLDPVFAALTQFEVDHVDPVVCPVLVAHAGDYGPVEIRPDGDTYVPDPATLGLNPVYDCPPYGDF